VLTDVVHLVEAIRAGTYSPLVVILVLVPLYAVFMALGFGAYVVSLRKLGRYLRAAGHPGLVVPVELALHGLCSVGIYLGRFERFNSWAVVTRLDDLTDTVLDTILNRQPVVVIAATFLALNALYWPVKRLTPPSRRRGAIESRVA
jgi:uncharacterized membrane protein